MNIGPDIFGRAVMKMINSDGSASYAVYTDMSATQLVFVITDPSGDDTAAMNTINSMEP